MIVEVHTESGILYDNSSVRLSLFLKEAETRTRFSRINAVLFSHIESGNIIPRYAS